MKIRNSINVPRDSYNLKVENISGAITPEHADQIDPTDAEVMTRLNGHLAIRKYIEQADRKARVEKAIRRLEKGQAGTE